MARDIIIDATHVKSEGATGVENYVTHVLPLVSKLLVEKGWDVRWVGHDKKSPVKLPKGVTWIHSPHSFYWSQLALSRLLKQQKPFLFFTPSGIPPVMYRGRTAVTVHDMSAYITPEVYSRGQLFRLRQLMKQAVRNASIIFTPSTYSKEQILRFWSLDPENIFVTPLSHDSNGVHTEPLDGVDTTKPLFVYVGRIEAKKNLSRIIAAFSDLDDKHAQLVIAGKDGVGAEALRGQIATLPEKVRSRILMPGYISDGQREWLLSKATAFLVPGALEGFSLPLLEAFKHSLPAICADAGPLPEIGADACLYADPKSTKSWTRAMKDILTDKKLRTEIAKKAAERVKEFTWEKTAKETARAIAGE